MAPAINELVVYVPARDFELSKRFYSELGFTLTDAFGETMDCRLGTAVFRLQNYYVKDWAENFMMKFDVPDIEAWHAQAKRVLEGGNFADARCDEVQTVEDARVFHVWDPSGVLLVFVE
jgi:predicted enzyme related to lactoylglutathione lyase